MSDQIRKRKVSNKYRDGLDALLGDSAEDAQMAANVLAELGTGAAKMYADKAKKDAEAQKAKDDAAKAEAAKADEKAAEVDYNQKAKAAAMAAADAKAAQLKAATESDPKGPLHQAASQAASKSALYAADMQAAADKLAFYRGGSSALVKGGKSSHGGSSLPSWALPVGVGVGALVLGVVGYKLLKRK